MKLIKMFSKRSAVLLVSVFFVLLFNGVESEALNIVLDPGHGGSNFGACAEYDGKFIKEEQLNYKIALSMQQQLQKYKTKAGKSVNVYLTRNKGETLNITTRVNRGKRNRADIFISLHNNASYDGSRKSRGSMALVTNSTFNGLKKREEGIAKNILEELNTIGISPSFDTLGGKAINKHGILYRLSSYGKTYPNGDITDWYGIVREGVYKKLPAIVIEHAYLDNEQDYRNFLSSDEKLEKLAQANVRAIVKYYSLVYSG